MAKTRRIIRKTHPTRYRGIDDQLWPLVIACCVLGGFLAGTVLAYFRLDNPRWYANAWTWLIAIPLVISSLLVTLALTGNRLLRRSMQLALVLGLTFHLILLIFSIETDVFHRVWTEVLASARRPSERKVVKVPDYASWQHDPQQRTRRDLEQPLETQPPDPVLEPAPREKVQEDPTDVQVEPPQAPETPRVTRPDVVRSEQPPAAVPRQSEQMSKLSRRDAVLPPLPTQAVRTADVQRMPERRPDVAAPGAAGTLSAKQLMELDRSSLPTATQLPESAPTSQLARKSPPTDTPRRLSSTASMQRSETRPGITPRTEVQVADKPAVARQNQPAAVAPNNTAARKQQTRSPVAQEQAALPVQELTSEVITRRRVPQQATPLQRSLAQTPRSVPNRQPRVTPRPDVATIADVPAKATTSQSETASIAPTPLSRLGKPAAAPEIADPVASPSQPDSTAARVTPATAQRATAQVEQPATDAVSAKLPGRQLAAATAIGGVPQRVSPLGPEATAREPAPAASSGLAASPAEVPKSAAGNTMAQRRLPSTEMMGAARQPQSAPRQPTRVADAARPSLGAQATANQPARRATREALEASSPARTENLVRNASDEGSQALAAEPSAMALSKAQSGTAGYGASANLGLADPSADSPANVASGSAHRAEALQAIPKGPALSPQAPALVRGGRAGEIRPSAILQATPLTPATLPGSRDPGEVNASASAALTQAASDAAQGAITASKGAWEVDLGPTTTVAEMGVGRASGGGQPDRSVGAQTETVPRRSPDVTPTASLSAASLLADATSPLPAAPLSDRSGAASPVDLASNPNASASVRQAADAPAAGGPPADMGGMLAVPAPSLAASHRRTVGASEGPETAEDAVAAPYAPRKASRDRQLEGTVSVADLSVGNAANHNDRQLPAATIAANSAAGAIDKQATGQNALSVADTATSAVAPGDRSGGVLAGRSEAVEAMTGTPQVGGGTDAALRSAQGPELVANTQADMPEMAGAPSSSGRAQSEPQSTQGTLITKLADGVDAPRNDARVGAIAAALTVDAAEGDAPGVGPRRRAQGTATSDGPAMQDNATADALEKRSVAVLPPSVNVAIPLDGMTVGASAPTDEDSEPGPIARSPNAGVASRLSGAALPVSAEAVAGPGGLSRETTVEVGVRDRHASETSYQVQLEVARFARQRVGGMPEFNTAAAVPTEPFRRRERRGDGMGDLASGAGPQTEEAIELGLVFLSRAQTPDGRWALDQFAEQDGLPQLGSDTAATGLALLAFQGAGYHHLEYRYAHVVRRGIDFLVQNQQANGNLFVGMDEESNRVVALYSHSIAALALCEAYGMTQDANLREPAQKAIDFIVQTQHPQRGGWRYSPRIGSDTSVTGWMMMALKSGELANLKVPDDTYERIRQWLDKAQASSRQPYLYCYNPFAPDTAEQRGGRRPTRTMTSVGLLMRLYSGWRRDNANMVLGAQYLLQYPPSVGTTSNPQRDTYYWYYATQVMFHMGGQYWSAWNQRLHPLLIGSQLREGELAGSWDPFQPVPDEWAAFAGRLYVTTMNLLSLEVTYRHLPLYEDTAR